MSVRPQHRINDQVRQKGPTGGAHPRTGLVSAIELNGSTPTGRVRVRFPDRDDLESWWLHVVVQNTQDNKRYHGPDVGEQVACLMDELDENGFVLGAVYSVIDAPASDVTTDDDVMRYKDTAVVGYNRATHTLAATLPAQSTITVETGSSSVVNITMGENCSLTLRLGSGITITMNSDGTIVVNATTSILWTTPLWKVNGS